MMINPISPEFVHVIHQDKIRELEREIEMARRAKEMRAYTAGGSLEQGRAWYAGAAQWMKEKLLHRAAESKGAGSQPAAFEEPCPGVPC